MIRLLSLALIAGVLLTSGCATITRGTTSDVQFISNPPGAAVTTSLGPACTAPCSLKFDRRDTFTAVFTLNGQIQQVFVDTEVAAGGVAGVAGNVIVGGVIGAGIDVATGAGLNHVPNPVVVAFDLSETVDPEDPATRQNPDADAVVAAAPPADPVPAGAPPVSPATPTASDPTSLADAPNPDARDGSTGGLVAVGETPGPHQYGGAPTPGVTEDSSPAEKKCRPYCL